VIIDLQTRTMAASYPTGPAFQITRPEEDGLSLVQQGIPNQMYAIPPLGEGGAAGTSFLAAIPHAEGGQLVLIGRADLSTNAYVRSLISNLNSLAEVNGAGMLIADGRIVYSSRTEIWTAYEGKGDQPAFQWNYPGNRQLVYYQRCPAIMGSCANDPCNGDSAAYHKHRTAVH
jgi:hypothetical protein